MHFYNVQRVFLRHHGIEVKDFGPSWRDGVAFQSVVHAIRPDLVDMDVVRRRSNRENLEEAFALAEKELGIPRLLDPEGAPDFCCHWKINHNITFLCTLDTIKNVQY